MTKEQILTRLKPLEWFDSNCYQGQIARVDLCQVAFIKIEYAIPLDEDFNFYKLMLNDEELYGDSFETLDQAKSAAQEHYNNLVLELFNLEVENES